MSNYTPRKWEVMPAAEDFPIPAPPTREPDNTAPLPPPAVQEGVARVLTKANLMITAIIIAGMWFNGEEVVSALITGGSYFAVTMICYVLFISGQAAAIVGIRQRERTERLRVEAWYNVATQALHWRMAVEQNRTLELQAQALPVDIQQRVAQLERHQLVEETAAPVQTPYAATTFVAPYPATRVGTDPAEEALAWACELYRDSDGRPDPEKVVTEGDKAGWIRGKMLGSKRGSGSREAGLWLLHRGVVRQVAGGYALDIKRFPHRGALRRLRG